MSAPLELAFFFGGSPSTPEMMLVLLAVLLLFGAKKLPEIARGLGKSMEEFRRAARDVTDEIMHADARPVAPRPLPPRPTTPPAPAETHPEQDPYAPPSEDPYGAAGESGGSATAMAPEHHGDPPPDEDRVDERTA